MMNFDVIWEERQKQLWQQVYDQGFCDALEKGCTLDEACEAGDMRVFRTAVSMQTPRPEDY